MAERAARLGDERAQPGDDRGETWVEVTDHQHGADGTSRSVIAPSDRARRRRVPDAVPALTPTAPSWAPRPTTTAAGRRRRPPTPRRRRRGGTGRGGTARQARGERRGRPAGCAAGRHCASSSRVRSRTDPSDGSTPTATRRWASSHAAAGGQLLQPPHPQAQRFAGDRGRVGIVVDPWRCRRRRRDQAQLVGAVAVADAGREQRQHHRIALDQLGHRHALGVGLGDG